ncbi:putative Zn(II)2Cys6 transcription factor-like protein [Setomelanomma holmii]|uniref:Zn(II)2Cys6 transcription factor-like protein n=1 Tax=Setomelanomma holmii TaxID=210430 RepID=A0A9P4LLJ7_9PLEO|nr:putative Zn(II)2Cys6 transcription factor-like protein [Setomelanomma holmii]
MPEENWAAHGGIQACDLCHARKVKCDRKEPCGNCVAAKAACLRNRHKQKPRPKVRTDDKIQALVNRLSNLEHSVLNTQPASDISITSENFNPSATPEVKNSSERPLKRKRTESLASAVAPTSTSVNEVVVAASREPDTTQQPVTEARSLISTELSTNSLLCRDQRNVLERAIAFVDQLSHAPVPSIKDRSTFDKTTMYGSTILSQSDILHVILGTETKSVDATTVNFHSLDHIPPKAVERIGLTLMEGTADESTLLLCKVIIHFKAAVVLYASNLQGPKSPEVQKHIKQLEYDHLTTALTALDSVSFLTTPSLLLVQALITGGMMMQIIGNPASCWELIAYASRVIVALGYHTAIDMEPKTDLDEEIRAAVAWCSQFDSCMSLLLLRPRSLPPLNVRSSSLLKPDPANPMSIFEIIAMEMIPVHYKILELTLDANAKRRILNLKADVAGLRASMSNIFALMMKERPSHLLDTHPDILLHWKCLKFKYFSTLSLVHRLSPTVTTVPSEREECLQSAREALECVKFIEDIGKALGHFIEGYDPYLAWTMLSYPLCPFFVVFCNVVGTSNARDFQLLQDVTDGISALVSDNKFVNRLHRLCEALLELCRPLIHREAASGQIVTNASRNEVVQGTALPTTESSSEQLGAPIADGEVDNFLTSSWNDDMMWQLFQSQPSLDWFNAEILDPPWDMNLPK